MSVLKAELFILGVGVLFIAGVTVVTFMCCCDPMANIDSDVELTGVVIESDSETDHESEDSEY